MAGMPKEPFSYEFSAPRFHDFSRAQSPAALVDAWFERQPHTGAVDDRRLEKRGSVTRVKPVRCAEKKSGPQLAPAQEVSDLPQLGCSQAEVNVGLSACRWLSFSP